MEMQARTAEQNPMMEMNITPLIDVMLVLLVMFIITIPIQSHAVKLDLPGPVIAPQPTAISNTLEITRVGTLLWNGQPITRDGLKFDLERTQQMQPVPELHLRPDPQARYEVVDEVLAIVKREQVRKVGFVGNEAYSNW
ncbi:MAG TPA: biopolymer transporter ExbD [Sphingomicrobium sp.]|jgi:biopolymer transport protein ExbD|nr:biopolymer transporter ExbD [Sphingomicrobium sp.]